MHEDPSLILRRKERFLRAACSFQCSVQDRLGFLFHRCEFETGISNSSASIPHCTLTMSIPAASRKTQPAKIEETRMTWLTLGSRSSDTRWRERVAWRQISADIPHPTAMVSEYKAAATPL